METAESTKVNSFETQFKTRREFRFSEGKIQVVDIAPDTLKDDVPVFIAPGWSETPTTYKRGIKHIFENEGRRVITFAYPRVGGWVVEDEENPLAEVRKANVISLVLNEKKIPKVDVIAQSEAAINVLIAASLEPFRFRNIILMHPAGLIGRDNIVSLSVRFLNLLANDAKSLATHPKSRSNLIVTAQETAKYVMANPVRAIDEAQAIAGSDIHDMLSKISEKGVNISIVAGVDDPLCPIGRIIEEFRKDQEKTGKNPPLAGFYSVVGSHNEHSASPERFMAFAINALNGLQRKR